MTNFIVQEISVIWTKDSRGGKNASLRNAVPLALPLVNLPSVTGDDLTVIHAKSIYHENEQFKPPTPQITAKPVSAGSKLYFPGIRIKFAPQNAEITYTYSSTAVGAPTRYPASKTVTINMGEWARVMFNGRFGWDAEWSYKQTVLNIGMCENVERGAFLGEPPHIIRDMADLW